MLIGSNPKKNEDLVAFLEGKSRFELSMVFPAMWKFCRWSENSEAAMNENLTVNSRPRTD
jgi:hypothetical protein